MCLWTMRKSWRVSKTPLIKRRNSSFLMDKLSRSENCWLRPLSVFSSRASWDKIFQVFTKPSKNAFKMQTWTWEEICTRVSPFLEELLCSKGSNRDWTRSLTLWLLRMWELKSSRLLRENSQFGLEEVFLLLLRLSRAIGLPRRNIMSMELMLCTERSCDNNCFSI